MPVLNCLSCQVTVISMIWTVLCAVASGLFSEVVFKLQEDNWDDSTDERIEWRYQHAQAAVVWAFPFFIYCHLIVSVRLRNFNIAMERPYSFLRLKFQRRTLGVLSLKRDNSNWSFFRPDTQFFHKFDHVPGVIVFVEGKTVRNTAWAVNVNKIHVIRLTCFRSYLDFRVWEWSKNSLR